MPTYNKALNWSESYELSDEPNVCKQDWNTLVEIAFKSLDENESGEAVCKLSHVKEAK